MIDTAQHPMDHRQFCSWYKRLDGDSWSFDADDAYTRDHAEALAEDAEQAYDEYETDACYRAERAYERHMEDRGYDAARDQDDYEARNGVTSFGAAYRAACPRLFTDEDSS